MKFKELKQVIAGCETLSLWIYANEDIYRTNDHEWRDHIELHNQELSQKYDDYDVLEVFSIPMNVNGITLSKTCVNLAMPQTYELYKNVNALLEELEGEQWLQDMYNEMLDKFE